ncbi:MAG: hypothetical protein ACK45B_01835 [Limisphaerales bacterium]|jgi:hypothetical protein
MSSEQKKFLKMLRQKWAEEFPFLRPVELNEVPVLPKGCKFRCDDYVLDRGIYYFITIDFSQRRLGEFSVRVTVSDVPDKSIWDPATDDEPGPNSLGSHSIATFMGRQAYRWDLLGLAARNDAAMHAAGIHLPGVSTIPSANTWHPSSYDRPFEQIANEAINDVSDKLRKFVFPKLRVEICESVKTNKPPNPSP